MAGRLREAILPAVDPGASLAPLFTHACDPSTTRARRDMRRAWLALLGWALLTFAPPAIAGGQLLERAGASDDGAGLVFAADDATEPAAIPPRDQRAADPLLPPLRELAAAPAWRRPEPARAGPADGLDVPACRAVARWCLARATSTSLS